MGILNRLGRLLAPPPPVITTPTNPPPTTPRPKPSTPPPTDGPRAPFDPTTTKLYCSACGAECVVGGHMASTFLLCPQHGEFTIAPIVVQRNGSWEIHYRDNIERSMWETCAAIDQMALARGSAQTGPLYDEPPIPDAL